MPSTSHVALGGQEFAIAPIRLGRMKKLRGELAIVMASRHLTPDQLPEENVIDAYVAIIIASICLANPAQSEEELRVRIDDLPPFDGIADLAIATARIVNLSMGDVPPGEAVSPAASPSLISTGSTP